MRILAVDRKQSALINFPFPSLCPSSSSSSSLITMDPSFSSWSTEPNDQDSLKERSKKPRHRHSAFQLAALNELYERNEHPSLDDRTTLAEKLGMYALLSTHFCYPIRPHAMSNIGKQRQSMLGFRINALPTRSALVPDFPPPHTISHRSPPYSAPLIPPLLRSSRTIRYLISTLPPFSPVFNSLLHVFPEPHPLQRLRSSRPPFTLATQNVVIRTRAPHPSYPLVPGSE